MLGDAAGFARHHVGVAQRVEQRGLAVVDVTHHGHDRRTRLGIGGIVDDVEQAFFDVGRGDALDGVAHFLGDQLRGVGVDHVGDLVHRALLHQQADDVDRALGHAVGEFLDGDRFRNDHLADELFLRLVRGMALQALGAAAERGDRALAHVVGSERGDDGQAAALLLRTGLVRGLGRQDRRGRRRRDRAGSGADLHPHRWLSAATPGARAAGIGGARASWSPALLPPAVAGLASRLRQNAAWPRVSALRLASSSMTVTLFLGLAAGFGGFALGLLDAFAAGAALGFLFGDPPFLDVANLGVGQRAGAGGTLVLGQRAQHDARIAARRGRRCRTAASAPWAARAWRQPARARGLPAQQARRRDAALAALLDHDLLGAAMAETLAHGAGLDARLQRQGLARHTQSLVARRFGINHSAVLISLRCARCAQSLKLSSVQNSLPAPAVLSSSAIRYRTRIWLRDRKVLLAGPASSAACITFDRPSAKSNCCRS